MDEAIEQLARELFERRGDGVIVPGVRVATANGEWQPRPNECHDNVNIWVRDNPQYKRVWGFLIFDLEELLPYMWFNAHSVVESPDGSLRDITPAPMMSNRYPFLRHIGSDDLFAEAARRVRLTHYWR